MLEARTGISFENGYRGYTTAEPQLSYSFERLLTYLDLDLMELGGKRVLDVCIGGGSNFNEALEFGVDIYGVDIIPAIQINEDAYYQDEEAAANITAGQELLVKIAKEHPGRIFGVDATSALPFADSYFDIVLSYLGMPSYARNIQEAEKAIMEMVRVARERVVFSGGWDTKSETGIIRLGIKGGFSFPLKSFLESKALSYKVQYIKVPREHTRRSIHIDLTT